MKNQNKKETLKEFSVRTEIKLLESLCGESIPNTSLYNYKHDTDAQLVIIGGYCHQLGMSISDMVTIGTQHAIGERSEHLLKNLTMFYQLSFEDIVRKMCEATTMTEEQIDSMIDKISLFHHEYDTFYVLSVDGIPINLGDNALSWLPYNEYIAPTGGNLRRNFSLFKMIDAGTEMEFTNEGEFGYINGVRYELANISDNNENALLLSMLRTATQKLLAEMKGE